MSPRQPGRGPARLDGPLAIDRKKRKTKMSRRPALAPVRVNESNVVVLASVDPNHPYRQAGGTLVIPPDTLCHWPSGDPRNGTMVYCTAPACAESRAAGRSYCAQHWDAMWSKATRRKRDFELGGRAGRVMG